MSLLEGSDMPEILSVWSPGLDACPGTLEPGIVDCCFFSCFLGFWERVFSRTIAGCLGLSLGRMIQEALRLPTPGGQFLWAIPSRPARPGVPQQKTDLWVARDRH